MITSAYYQRHRPLLVATCVITAILAGCGSEAEIRSYPVAKETPALKSESTRRAALGEATHRMMGAILPAGGQTWYFKVVGPISDMEKNAGAITQFFQSITTSPGATKPGWKVPAGWEEKPASGMRAATILIPEEGKPLDLSVIALPTSGAPSELLDNVNRWRGQLQLPPLDEASLATATKQLKVGDATMTLVDERGQFSAGSMSAPFAGGGPFSGGPPATSAAPGSSGAPPSAAADPAASTDLPAGHPPIDSAPSVASTGSAPFDYKAPEGWESQPPSGFRKVAFKLNSGDQKADVTAIDLSASAPSVANPLENINRWRGELRMAPITQEQVGSIIKQIQVGGIASVYVELIPDSGKPEESQSKEATFAATVPAGQVVWFFKLRGDRDLVLSQRDNFKTFLESVRFKSADGAGDGNNQ
jgi:hypothetical protein